MKKLFHIVNKISNQNTGGFVDGNTTSGLDDYEYDANDFRVKKIENLFCEESERSSMIKERNKGIESITYNHLNLPTRVNISNNKYISYRYNAAGQKLQKVVNYNDSIKTVDYLDGFQYAGERLQFFPHPEGYVKVSSRGENSLNMFNYVFNYTDHLGNVRLSYTKDPQTGTLDILDEDHYYPFGLKHGVYAAANLKDFTLKGGIDTPILEQVRKTEYQYKYNGKEWQDELGLNWTSMDFRNYDPAIGRFHSPDPLAEYSMSWSPFRFAYDNPVFWSDPTGLYEYDEDGTVRSRGVQDGEIEFIQNYIIENGVDGLEMALQDAGFGIDLAEATITKKAKSDFTFSNSCIVGCHNSGGKYDFDSSNFSILRKTESETFYKGGWGVGGGFTHNNKFYKPGIDKLEENDLLEWLAMLRTEFGDASSMSLQAYSDIFTLVQIWKMSGNNGSVMYALVPPIAKDTTITTTAREANSAYRGAIWVEGKGSGRTGTFYRIKDTIIYTTTDKVEKVKSIIDSINNSRL